ncbi:zinc finger MYND domain-containing protein 15 isoform X2 [Alligator mississippiensis]|uniref:zinc finger MYND domain-containing protein 15 isoform X2 n=1 Tax=Alligator mississippiensis TaxID=8496 RepID=UPI002877955E|nr:zinc finger MYND domain-containing protein 15 isoform X2 [Alligator mississippiensis]
MEFVTGYRAEVLDLAELLLGWHRRLLGGGPPRPPRRLPPDPARWVLQLLPNPRLALALALAPGGPGGGAPRGRLCGEEPLQLRDLLPGLGFLRLDGPDARPGPGQVLLHVERLLLVTDERGALLGLDFQLAATGAGIEAPALGERALRLVAHTMAGPLGGGEPRRPRALAVTDAELYRALEPLLQPRLGVKLAPGPLRGWGPAPGLALPPTRVRACHACRRHGFAPRLAACPQCRAVLYCSERCRQRDAGHRAWCQRLGRFVARARELADLPFTFAAETTSDTFDREAFLAGRGLTVGLWTLESLLVRAPDYGVGLGGDHEREPSPPHSGNPLEGLAPEGGPPLPIAPTQPPPPRTYFIPELNILNKRSLKIHVLEAGKELGLAPLFGELSLLLPDVSLELLLSGQALPPAAHGRLLLPPEAEGGRPRGVGGRGGLQLRICARPSPLLQGPKPDLVLGFNPGFALKDTWLSLLPRLQALRVPAYFTECSEYSCAVDQATVAAATGGSASPPQLNPFRSPLRRPGLDNTLPWLVLRLARVGPGLPRGRAALLPAQCLLRAHAARPAPLPGAEHPEQAVAEDPRAGGREGAGVGATLRGAVAAAAGRVPGAAAVGAGASSRRAWPPAAAPGGRPWWQRPRGAVTAPPKLNPFRSPLRRPGLDNVLPWLVLRLARVGPGLPRGRAALLPAQCLLRAHAARPAPLPGAEHPEQAVAEDPRAGGREGAGVGATLRGAVAAAAGRVPGAAAVGAGASSRRAWPPAAAPGGRPWWQRPRGAVTAPPKLNPFRSPLRRPGLDNVLPWYPNAFILHLLYKGGAGGGRPGAPPAPSPPPAASCGSEPAAGRSWRKDKRQPRGGKRRR